MKDLEKEKELAAIKAVHYVQNDMTVGLGTGSTAYYLIRELGKKVSQGLQITCVSSSKASTQLALENSLKIVPLSEVRILDINIDGADEFDPNLRLMKGGGGALLHEKILASNAKFNLIICDSSKQVSGFGKFKLPIETIPLATESIRYKLQTWGVSPVLRVRQEVLYRTEEGNMILDLDISAVEDIESFNQQLIALPGVVETGLFVNYANLVLMGKEDSVVSFPPNPSAS